MLQLAIEVSECTLPNLPYSEYSLVIKIGTFGWKKVRTYQLQHPSKKKKEIRLILQPSYLSKCRKAYFRIILSASLF